MRLKETRFRTFGLGEIADAYEVKVTRERNGNYSLYIKYPLDGVFASVFKEEMKIKSDAGRRTSGRHLKSIGYYEIARITLRFLQDTSQCAHRILL
ncbi:Phage endopeptidase [Streptococcus dysgalactiae]|nr:Phage endopeptidase [Streptococcus dysgalactiae]